MVYSVVVPVYRNEQSVPLLLSEFDRISREISQQFHIAVEFVFVVDASPDGCYSLLLEQLPLAPFASKLVLHARNFGSFSAVRTGLQAGTGKYFGVIAADLQEPPELLVDFLAPMVADEQDIVIGVRTERDDPALARVGAKLFWNLYRQLVIPELPEGGVDVFGCTRRVRDELLNMSEANSSLVGLVFWLGFRRKEVPYSRAQRPFGKSAWTLRKKINYLLDSVFSFTDLPIRLLSVVGLFGLCIALVLSAAVVILRVAGGIAIPGYAATMIAVTFFGALNTFGLGLVGSYAWRTYENSKGRPLAVIQSVKAFPGTGRDTASNDSLQATRTLPT